MATTGKIAEVMFAEVLDTFQPQDQMLDLVTFLEPDPSTMQNGSNVLWRPYQQHRPILSGWDLTGQEQTIIQETYPAVLGTPKSDLISQRADDLRDMQFWRDAGRTSAMQQVTELNKSIASAATLQGSMFYRTNATSGYDVVGEAQAIMNERQGKKTTRNYIFNDRDNLKFSKDLAGRQTVQGRPERVWSTGEVGQNIAEFDIFTASYLPSLVGGANPATTVTGNQSFKPDGGSVDPVTKVVTNIDARSATITVAASASYNIGDKVTFANGGTTVKSVGLADKNSTGQAMTFTIVAKPSGTSVTIFPKPIALDDPALTALEKAYANIDTRILNAATMDRINTDASKKANIFFDKDAIEVFGGTIPAQLFRQFDGLQVIQETMKNGLTMYMVYDANMINMTFRFRIFTWYEVTIKDPSRVGVAVTF